MDDKEPSIYDDGGNDNSNNESNNSNNAEQENFSLSFPYMFFDSDEYTNEFCNDDFPVNEEALIDLDPMNSQYSADYTTNTETTIDQDSVNSHYSIDYNRNVKTAIDQDSVNSQHSTDYNRNVETTIDQDSVNSQHSNNYTINTETIIDDIPKSCKHSNNKHLKKSKPNSRKGIFRKKFVEMSNDAIFLKGRFYSIFTTKKVFEKEKVVAIHDTIVVPCLSSITPEFVKVSRNEKRDIRLYFVHYAKHKDQLLECLEKNKKFILGTILKELDKKKKV